MSPNKELSLYFIVSLFLSLTFPPLFPNLKIYFFIPFLVRSFYLKNKTTSLWLSLFAGLIVDLLSDSPRFGLIPCNYVITSFFLYSLKNRFFEDYFTTLGAVTFLYSLFSTLLQLALLYLLDRSFIEISFSFIFKDLALMPLQDAFFAVLFFSLPLLLFKKPSRAGSDYFTS